MDLQQAHRRYGRLPVLFTPFEERMNLLRPGPLSDWVRQLHVERIKYQLLTDEVIREQTAAGKGVLNRAALRDRQFRRHGGQRQARAVPDEVVVTLRAASRARSKSPAHGANEDAGQGLAASRHPTMLSVSGRRSVSPAPPLPPISSPHATAALSEPETKSDAVVQQVDKVEASGGANGVDDTRRGTSSEHRRSTAVHGGHEYDTSQRMAMPVRPMSLGTMRMRGGVARRGRSRHDDLARRVDKNINFAGSAPTFGRAVQLEHRRPRERLR